MMVLGSLPEGGGHRLTPRPPFETAGDVLARAHRILWSRGPGAVVRRAWLGRARLSRCPVVLETGVEPAAAGGLREAAFHFAPGALDSGLFEPDGAAALKALAGQIADGLFVLDAPALQSEALARIRPELYTAGLSGPLLRIAAAYLGLDCLYLGATLKREVADGRAHGTRQWHLDIEDERFLRVLLYLSPVTRDAGPFQHLSAPLSAEVRQRLGYRIGYLNDEVLAKVAPPDRWQAVLGEAGDAMLFDGTRLFHRAQPPTARERWSITFTYASRNPLELQFSTRLSVASHRRLTATLPEELRRCIPPPTLFW
jgi:hypothetical protein